MAQDQRKALDEKTRKLGSAGKIDTGKEHAAYQETQQQLLAIQAEQQRNLAVARAESKASSNTNQTLAQAAEIGAMSAAEAEQAALSGGGTQQLNPATQAVLSKYGMGQPKFMKNSSHTQQVTKQNITINNNTTVNTTNDVKVPANIGGPLQGRPLQFKSAAASTGTATSSVGKFKSWISSVFARQDEEGKKRDREYRQRESSLSKSASRMMKKLEEIGKTIGTRMDPRKIGSTWQSQLKTLMFLFGFGYLASNWTKLLERVASIENWFKEDFANFFGFGLKNNEESGFHKFFRKLLGGKEGEGLFESFSRLLYEGDESLLGYIKLWLRDAMEERSRAIKLIKFPQLDIDDVIGSIGKIGSYLGDLFSALVSGAEGAKNSINTQIKTAANKGALESMSNDDATRETRKILANVNGKTKAVDADKGIEALFADSKTGEREHSGLTRYSLDENGELTGSTESTYAQSVHLESAYKDALDGKKAFNTADVAKGIERLYNAAIKKQETEKHGIPIAKDFLDLLSNELFNKLKNEGKIEIVPYHAVARKKTEEDYAIEEANPGAMAVKAYYNKAILDTTPLGEVSDKIAQAKGAATGVKAGIATGGGLTPITTALGYILGGLTNNKTSRAVRSFAEGSWNKLTSNDYRIEYVRGEGTNEGDTVNMVEITPEGIQDVANFLTNKSSFDTKKQANIDITNREFTDSIRESFESVADKNIKILERQYTQAQAQAKRSRDGRNTTWIREKINKAKEARNGIDDTDLKNLYDGIESLEEIEEENRQKEKEAWNNTRASKSISNITEKANNIVGNLGLNINNYIPTTNKVKSVGTEIKGLSKDQSDKAVYTIKRLMKEGLTAEQASGIAGNIMKESGFNPKSGTTDNNLQYAGGIVGWNGSNYEAAKNYFGRDLKQVSYEDQLEYLIKELKGEAGVIRAQNRDNFAKKHGFKSGDNIFDIMKTTTSVADSTHTFERVFEGSGDYKGYWERRGGQKIWKNGDGNQRRINYATSFYQSFTGLTPEQQSNYDINVNPVQKSKAVISLIGDSYAVGMASAFVKEIEKHGAEGKCIPGTSENHASAYCFSGARAKQIQSLAGNAVGSQVVVIHAGLNDCASLANSDGGTLFMELNQIAKVASSKGAKVFFIAPITNQTVNTIKVGPINCAVLLGNLIKDLCSAEKYGLIDLSGKTYELANDGLHPKNYQQMAKDVVDLLFKGGGAAGIDINQLVQQGGVVNTEEETKTSSADKPQSFISIFMNTIKDMLFNLGSGFMSITEDIGGTISKSIETGANKIVEKLNDTHGKITGGVTSEFINYNSYLQDPGQLPSGLNETDWSNEVYKRTDLYPYDLMPRFDEKAEKARQSKIKNEKLETSKPVAEKDKYKIIDPSKPVAEKDKSKIIDPRNYDDYDSYVNFMRENGFDDMIMSESNFLSYKPLKNIGFNNIDEWLPEAKNIEKLYLDAKEKSGKTGENPSDIFAQSIMDHYGLDITNPETLNNINDVLGYTIKSNSTDIIRPSEGFSPIVLKRNYSEKSAYSPTTDIIDFLSNTSNKYKWNDYMSVKQKGDDVLVDLDKKKPVSEKQIETVINPSSIDMNIDSNPFMNAAIMKDFDVKPKNVMEASLKQVDLLEKINNALSLQVGLSQTNIQLSASANDAIIAGNSHLAQSLGKGFNSLSGTGCMPQQVQWKGMSNTVNDVTGG